MEQEYGTKEEGRRVQRQQLSAVILSRYKRKRKKKKKPPTWFKHGFETFLWAPVL